MTQLGKYLRILREYRTIQSSKSFDAQWYVQQYPDVATMSLSPLWHYVLVGARIGFNPNKHFDSRWYLQQNQDVALMNDNPYAHYLLYGQHEHRLPRPPAVISTSKPAMRPAKVWQVRDRVSHYIRGAVYNIFPKFVHEDAFVAPNLTTPQPFNGRGDESHYHKLHDIALQKFDDSYDAQKLNDVYLMLSDEYSQEMFVQVLVARVMGSRKFRLPIYYSHVWNSFYKVQECQVGDSGFMRGVVAQFEYDLSSIGYNLKLFSSPIGVFSAYILEQYRYKQYVMAEVGDIIIDGGAFMGETSLYFGQKVTPGGHVYAFEFVPENVQVIRDVLDKNPAYRDSITVVERPLWKDSHTHITAQDNGPASYVVESQHVDTHTYTTISIDDFVAERCLDKVDYIKLDIEGSEMAALEGAREVITKYRPKIAVCLYHKNSDFWHIPQLLHEMVPEYEFYVDNFIAIPPWETVLFARVRS